MKNLKKRLTLFALFALLMLPAAVPGLALEAMTRRLAGHTVTYPVTPVTMVEAADDTLWDRLRQTADGDLLVLTVLTDSGGTLPAGLAEQLQRLQESKTLPPLALPDPVSCSLSRVTWAGSSAGISFSFLLVEADFGAIRMRAWLDESTGALCRLSLLSDQALLQIQDPALNSRGFLDNLTGIVGTAPADFSVGGWYDWREIHLYLCSADRETGAVTSYQFWEPAGTYYDLLISERFQ